jgi:glycerol-3-phosphate acyltransferase PlsX
MSKVVLDAVGGDHAPTEAVAGVKLALENGYLEPGEVILTGPEAMVRQAVTAAGLPESIEVFDAPDLLTSGDSPTDALRKKRNNSIAVGIGLVKAGRAGGFVSAGSTGTVVAAATVGLRYLEGIRKACIGAIIEGELHPFLVLDVGANPQPKPHHLAQFALMGSAYYRCQFGVERPNVGILNIGSEDKKGSPLVLEARNLMQQMPIQFGGNVEGVELFSGACQVVVTDGFSGNILLKASEGLAEYLLRATFQEMVKAGVSLEQMHAVKQAVMPRVDFSEYGGALLLGVEGVVTICHGRSQAPAFANALRFAKRSLEGEVNRHIVEAAAAMQMNGGGNQDASAQPEA